MKTVFSACSAVKVSFYAFFFVLENLPHSPEALVCDSYDSYPRVHSQNYCAIGLSALKLLMGPNNSWRARLLLLSHKEMPVAFDAKQKRFPLLVLIAVISPRSSLLNPCSFEIFNAILLLVLKTRFFSSYQGYYHHPSQNLISALYLGQK